MSTRKWNFNATDQDGNGVSEQVSAEFDALMEATRLEQIAPGRISLLFRLNLFGSFKAGRINPFAVTREIEALETGKTTGLKPPIQNKYPPLKGLWHKHYPQSDLRSLAINVQQGLRRFGIPFFEQKCRKPGKRVRLAI